MPQSSNEGDDGSIVAQRWQSTHAFKPQRPTSHSQLFPTPKLGVGNRECLGLGCWELGVDALSLFERDEALRCPARHATDREDPPLLGAGVNARLMAAASTSVRHCVPSSPSTRPDASVAKLPTGILSVVPTTDDATSQDDGSVSVNTDVDVGVLKTVDIVGGREQGEDHLLLREHSAFWRGADEFRSQEIFDHRDIAFGDRAPNALFLSRKLRTT